MLINSGITKGFGKHLWISLVFYLCHLFSCSLFARIDRFRVTYPRIVIGMCQRCVEWGMPWNWTGFGADMNRLRLTSHMIVDWDNKSEHKIYFPFYCHISVLLNKSKMQLNWFLAIKWNTYLPWNSFLVWCSYTWIFSGYEHILNNFFKNLLATPHVPGQEKCLADGMMQNYRRRAKKCLADGITQNYRRWAKKCLVEGMMQNYRRRAKKMPGRRNDAKLREKSKKNAQLTITGHDDWLI